MLELRQSRKGVANMNNTLLEQVNYCIINIDKVVESNHLSTENLEKYHASGFYYENAEGFYLVPDDYEFDNFDYGDTESSGILLDCDPLNDVKTFKHDLLTSLLDLKRSIVTGVYNND